MSLRSSSLPRVREKKPDIVAMSALLTTTMLAMKATIEALKVPAPQPGEGLGGRRPRHPEICRGDRVGRFSESAAGAVPLARRVMA